MPATFNQPGIHFQYPENWTVETDASSTQRRAVSVYSPGGAFWTVLLNPANSDPAELAQTALKTMQGEYDELDTEPAQEEIQGHELVGYDLNFYCLDLTNSAWIRACSTAAGAYLIICQAEDREFEKIAPVFRALTISLLTQT